jgi:two-component system, OmpR family, KDP operon response regulator KdpE
MTREAGAGLGAGPGIAREGARILIVEDDAATRQVLARELAAAGYRTAEAADGRAAVERFRARRPDLILLDLGLPDVDGVEVIRAIRREATTPIVILSGRFEEREKVDALDRGADDYVTKPFGVSELRARIRVALRHGAGPGADAEGVVAVGPIALDSARHQVRVGDRPVDLTPREFEILRVLLTHQGRIVTKGRLLRAVWGEAYQGEDDYVYVHVSSVRRKLNAAEPSLRAGTAIVTEPGVGYRVIPPAPREPSGILQGLDPS